MKKKLQILTTKVQRQLLLTIFCMSFSNGFSQTTYTFKRDSFNNLWSTPENWSPSYPGETINTGDTIIIENDNPSIYDICTIDVNLVNNGTIINNETISLLNSGFSFTNNGILENNYELLIIYDDIINNGLIINNNVIVGGGNFYNNVGAILENNNYISAGGVQFVNDGVINNNEAALITVFAIENNAVINNDGVINGSGILNPNINYNSGILSRIQPDYNSATLTFHGNLDLESTTIGIEIDATNQTNDVFSIVGNVNMEDAKLDVSWAELPIVNATYTVLTFTSINGIFSTVNIPPVTGFNFNVVYTDTEVNIEVTENGLGVNDLIIRDKIVFWPNPTDDFLNIDLSDYKDEVVIKIFNVFGKEIYNETHVNQQVISTNLNVDAGIYFVNVIDEKKNKKTFKVVKK